jgi:Na+-driven multidrug efflux pump
MFSLISLAATITSCLLLGLGLYYTGAALAAAIAFVVALICLLISVLYYLREVMDALSSVRDEQRDLRFMDLGSPPEPHPPRDTL